MDAVNSFVLSAVVTSEFYNSTIFQVALDIARDNSYPCFFVIDDNLDLPKGWDKNLKIEFFLATHLIPGVLDYGKKSIMHLKILLINPIFHK